MSFEKRLARFFSKATYFSRYGGRRSAARYDNNGKDKPTNHICRTSSDPLRRIYGVFRAIYSSRKESNVFRYQLSIRSFLPQFLF